MHFFLWMLRGLCGRIIYGNETMSEFRDYCQPDYKFLPTEMRLSQLIVVFKSGETVPPGGGLSGFKGRLCVGCGVHSCALRRCKAGLLTVRGHEQGRLLGRHIKNYYMERFGRQVQATALGVPTSSALTMLKSVVEALQIPEIDFGTEEAVGQTHACGGVRRKCLSPPPDFFGNPGALFDSAHPLFDQTVAGLCTDVSVECETPLCSLPTLRDALENIQMQFEDQMARTRESIVANGIQFAPLARLLVRATEAGSPLAFFAGETSTVYTLLNGLNIATGRIPPYGAAVFIEVWRHGDGREYVRVVYGTKAMRFGLQNEDLMPRPRFIRYLSVFADKDKAIRRICSSEDGTEKRIQHAHDAVLKLFEKDQGSFSDFLTNVI